MKAGVVALVRRYHFWLLAALIVVLLSWGWGRVTERRGDQRVAFRPAAARCGVAGRLRYCVYRDQRGTNGDLV